MRVATIGIGSQGACEAVVGLISCNVLLTAPEAGSMLGTLSFLTAVACSPAGGAPAPSDTLSALYQQGQPFAQFLLDTKSRKETWTDNYANGRVDDQTAGRIRALSGHWRLLVIAVDRCSDSANTIPFLARMVEASGGALEMRIVHPDQGKSVQEAHRTSDGRAATPTVILLDESGEEVGCWVERPTPLADWYNAQKPKMKESKLNEQKGDWYKKDLGKTTVRELLEMLEQAGPGRPCGGAA